MNTMNHIRISGAFISDTRPNEVVFKKLKRDAPNVRKQTETNRDGVVDPANYNNLNQF